MKIRFPILALASLLASTFVTTTASAACVNRFVSRTELPRQVVTLLTGKLTFQEAQSLADSIHKKEVPPIEWIDESGKTIARQFGGLKVIRPMPVGCDGKPSGVVMIATFATGTAPSKKMNIKLNPNLTVAFEEQAQ